MSTQQTKNLIDLIIKGLIGIALSVCVYFFNDSIQKVNRTYESVIRLEERFLNFKNEQERTDMSVQRNIEKIEHQIEKLEK